MECFVSFIFFLIVKSDRASMANSLEIRNPYLSSDIVNFSKSLPINYKLRNNEGKYILKSILYDHIPKNKFNKKKKGFLVPLKDWMQGDLRDWGEELLSNKLLRNNLNTNTIEFSLVGPSLKLINGKKM